MGQYTSYWLYQKYETRGSQEPIPCYPNVYSVDGDGTMSLVVRKEDDTQCGYIPPVEPVYRWVNISITQDYICDDCNEVEYRWINMNVNTDYYCEGTTKYYKQKKQQSSDGGQTWSDVVPAEYRKGGVAEEGSEDCGYIPPVTQYRWVKTNDTTCIQEGPEPPTPTGKKLVATYTGGTTREVECNSSTELTSGETKPSGYEYSAMTSAVIGSCTTSIGYRAFNNCDSLTSVTIPNSVTTIGERAFYDCYSLSSVAIPNSVTSLGEYAFANCNGLTNVTIPDSVTSIAQGTFEYCPSLTSITIGSGVTSIGKYAFEMCAGLTSVTIPNSVTEIGYAAFNNCIRLTSVTIGNSVTSIGQYIFYDCSSLTSVTIKATTPPTLGSYAFYNAIPTYIYVPAASVNAYKTATNWSAYASRIQPIT